MANSEIRKIRFLDDINPKGDRYRAVKARLSESFFRKNYQEAMQRVAESNLCNGRIESPDGRKSWIAHIDWFIRPDKVMEIMEGKFDNERWPIKEERNLPSDRRINL